MPNRGKRAAASNLKQFIDSAKTQVTTEINATRVATAVHLSRTLSSTGMSLAMALDRHAASLRDAATASDRYARNLDYATWALVAATIALVIVAAIDLVLQLAN